VGAEGYNGATISHVERFKAILGGEQGDAPIVELPFDAKERFGKARAPVRGTVNGTAYRTTVAVYGGIPMIGFNRELRERAGISIGDKVEVTVELDEEPRTVELPSTLKAALDNDATARAAFDALSYSHRREYAEWVAEAKREDTRARRVARTLEQLREGAP
jgi:bifunctional DNA-binding transcriptional regulator/antitoxin component of YhaV-PrlF toxin-antitoxin module